jgi:hypothetical protein
VSDADLDSKLALAQRELGEALERQAATDEVLQVIASSSGELEPVFQTILANATRICEANIGILFRYQNGGYSAVATLGVPQAYSECPSPTRGDEDEETSHDAPSSVHAGVRDWAVQHCGSLPRTSLSPSLFLSTNMGALLVRERRSTFVIR